MRSNGRKGGGFHVYNDNSKDEQFVSLKSKTSSVGSFPVAENIKENIREPTVWSNANVSLICY